MKVEIKVLPEAKEPYAVIYASEITPEIRRTADRKSVGRERV